MLSDAEKKRLATMRQREDIFKRFTTTLGYKLYAGNKCMNNMGKHSEKAFKGQMMTKFPYQ